MTDPLVEEVAKMLYFDGVLYASNPDELWRGERRKVYWRNRAAKIVALVKKRLGEEAVAQIKAWQGEEA